MKRRGRHKGTALHFGTVINLICFFSRGILGGATSRRIFSFTSSIFCHFGSHAIKPGRTFSPLLSGFGWKWWPKGRRL